MQTAVQRAQIVVVLHRTRNVTNIGGVVRAMKNMGFDTLRMVEPVPFIHADVTKMAHRSEDILAAARTYSTLDAALADTVYVVGTTEHAQGQHTAHSDIRTRAPDILAQAAYGRVALLFGPENNGLDTVDLDRCHTIVRLPTDPTYPSLNLAQAVLLLLYELRMVAESGQPDPGPAADDWQPAATAQLEMLFTVCEQALQAIGFFKTPHTQHVMRRLRAIVHRARPDQREVALLLAIARKVMQYVQRRSM